MAFFGRKSPLEAAFFKFRQLKERRREAQSKKVTERELSALHNKIVSLNVPIVFKTIYWFIKLSKFSS